MPLSAKETQALYQAWIDQLKGKKKQRQLGMLQDNMRLHTERLPVLTFAQFWVCMKHHGGTFGHPIWPTGSRGPYQSH